jgi:hypothetical protein
MKSEYLYSLQLHLERAGWERVIFLWQDKSRNPKPVSQISELG